MRNWIVFLKIYECFLSTEKVQKHTLRGDIYKKSHQLESIPSDQFDPECLPSIEATDLVSSLVLETSYYTKEQFKCSKSLEAYNQMVSGFVTSVQGKIIAGKHVVVGKVRHSQRSQRMNDPLVNIWVITESDGTILALQNVVVKCAKEFQL